MGSFESDLRILETELGVIATAFGELTDEQWRAPTLLIPLDEKLPHWTVFELAGHFDISIGLTRMLVADNTDGQVGRDRTSFFIFPRSEVAPAVYAYAYTMVEGKTPGQMPGVLAETFTKTIGSPHCCPARARSDPATTRSCGWTSSSPAASSRRSSTGSTSATRLTGRRWPPRQGLPQPPRSARRATSGSPYGARPTGPTSPTTWPWHAPPPGEPSTRIPGFPSSAQRAVGSVRPNQGSRTRR